MLHTSREGTACEIGGTARFVLECRSSGCQIAAWPASSRGVRAAARRLQARPRPSTGHGSSTTDSAVPDAGAIWGFCTIRSLSSACRRRVAALMVQFPPFAGGVIGRQAAPGASCSAILPFGGALDVGRARPCASNGAIPPVWWGFCTIRSLPSACRRRVAALMAQFPPSAAPAGGRSPASRASNGAIPPVCWQ